jgi:hypothetical protein
LSARLLGVELFAEGLYLLDRHHRFASSLSPELLPCHGCLVRPWMQYLVRQGCWMNLDRCRTYNLGLDQSLGAGLHGGYCSHGCLVVFGLYLLSSLGIFFTSSISINYAKEVFECFGPLSREFPCEFALEQTGRSGMDDRCFALCTVLAKTGECTSLSIPGLWRMPIRSC